MSKICYLFMLLGSILSSQAHATIIEDFEDINDCTGVTLENTTVYIGSGAGLWENHPSNTNVRKSFSPVLDVSDSDFISVMIYSEVANDAGVTWILYSENPQTSGIDYYSLPLIIDWTGWKYFKIARDDFGVARSPLGWDQITKISFTASGWGNTPASDTELIIDDYYAGQNWIQNITTDHHWNGSDYIFTYHVDIQNPDQAAATLNATILFPDGTPLVFNDTTLTLASDGSGSIDIEFEVTAAELASLTRLTIYKGKLLLSNSSHVLDGGDIIATVPMASRQSPKLFISESEITAKLALASSKPWIANAIADIIEDADEWPAKYLADYNLTSWALPPEGGQWASWYVCPTHGAYLKFDPVANTHTCPIDQVTYSGWPYDQVIYTKRHNHLAQYAKKLALAYQLTSTISYAQSARDILLAYAQIYNSYAIHDKDGTAKNSGARVLSQTLEEAYWLVDIAWSYDLIANSGAVSASQDTQIKTFLHDVVDIIARNNAGISNWQSWHNAAIGCAGLATEDWTLVAKAIEGQSGFLYQMQNSVLGDGMWYEGAWGYHFYALDALAQLAEGATRAGYNLWNQPNLQNMFTLPPGLIMPHGKLPAFNDSSYVTLNSKSNLYEMAYARLGLDELTLPIDPNSRGLDALVFGVQTLPTDFVTWANESEMVMTPNIITKSSAAHSGQRYAQIGYDTTHATLSAYGLYQLAIPQTLPNEIPTDLSLWLNGDNSGHNLTLRIYDANNERFTQSIGVINWLGWQKFTLSNPSTWSHFSGDNNGILDLPIKQIALQLNSDVYAEGSIGLDDISLQYTNFGNIAIEGFEVEPDSQIYPASGYAILNGEDQNGSKSYLAVDYGEHGGWHGHYDKLGFISYANGTLLGLDPGSHSYALPTHASWEKTTLAHNTVIVDETTQLEATGNLLENYLGKQVSMIRADAGGSYTQANLQRTMVLAGDYILDCYEVDSLDGNTHQYDWAYHNNGDLITSIATPNTPTLPADNGYQHLDNVASGTTHNDFYSLFTVGAMGSKSIGSLWSNESAMGQTFTAIENAAEAHDGLWYGKIDYDFTSASLSAYGLYSLTIDNDLPNEIPSDVTIWIYGDNSGQTLKFRLYDVNDERFIYTIGTINWTGWQQFTLSDPGNWSSNSGDDNDILNLPITKFSIEIDSNSLTSNTIRIDDLSFEYTGSDTIDIENFEQKRTGVKLHTLGVTDTQIVVADGMGNVLSTPTPMVLLRRNTQSTVFENLLENFDTDPDVSAFTKLSSTANSFAYAVTASNYQDAIFWTKDTILSLQSFGDFQTDGSFAQYRRNTDGTPAKLSTANATKLVHNTTTVFELGNALASFEAKWTNDGKTLVLYLTGNTTTTLQIQENDIEHIRVDGVAQELSFTTSNGIITATLPAMP